MGQKAADQLRQILIPDLLSLIGDPHTHLVTVELVQRYLQHNQLIFDGNTLADMFAEADFKKEGGLSSGPLIAAVQGRFPKRRYGQKDWLALVSVILKRPLPELQSLLAPPTKCGQATAAAQSMDIQAAASQSVTITSKKAAFVTKPATGEWSTLIRAASQCQAAITGSRPGSMLMTSRSAAMQSTAPAAMQSTAPAAMQSTAPAAMQRLTTTPTQHVPSASVGMSAAHFTPHAPSPSGDTAMQLSDAQTDAHSTTVKFQDDMGATAMSIDTPSYAKALGLGHTGLLGSRFGSNAGGLVQDLAQSMSIDENVTMQAWETFRPGATFASSSRMAATMGPCDQEAPTMMMTTSGPKSLNQTPVEEGINQDIRQGCSSFASQQQYHHHAAGLHIMADMTADAAHKRRPVLKVRH